MKRIGLALVSAVLVVIVAVVVWQVMGSVSSSPSADIISSGFIEARDVVIALEVGGRIVAIAAREGDEVKPGVPLVRLDDSLLKAQRQQAEAAVKVAQAGLRQALANQDQAIVVRDGAKKVWESTLDVLRDPLELEAKIVAAQGELTSAELAVTRAWRSSLMYWKWDYEAAVLRRDTARKVLDNLLEMKNNPQETNIAAERARVAFEQAVVGVTLAEKAVDVAQRVVEQAEASLNVINVQMSKLASSSPISGVVAAQHVEVGEIVLPGAPVLTITELGKVTLTAYVPESRLGRVKLGQKAVVTIDSYPGESFSGRVVYISPRAVFTPGNIQLKEEREKMVFAVKIALENPEQKLKPGMPADATILTSSEQ